MARKYQSDEQYEIQFTTRQLALLFGGLVLVVAGVFVGGILIGRGLAPGESAPLTARRATPAMSPATSPPLLTEPGPGMEADRTFGRAGTPDAAPGEAPGARDGARLQLPIRAGGGAAPSSPAAADPTPVPPPAVSTSPEQLASQAAARTPPSRGPSPATSTLPPSAPAAAPAPAELPRSTPDGPFTIQVGAFRDRSAAEATLARLAGRGRDDAYIEGTPAGIFRVRVGRFRSRDDARLVAASLQADFQTLVTRR